MKMLYGAGGALIAMTAYTGYLLAPAPSLRAFMESPAPPNVRIEDMTYDDFVEAVARSSFLSRREVPVSKNDPDGYRVRLCQPDVRALDPATRVAYSAFNAFYLAETDHSTRTGGWFLLKQHLNAGEFPQGMLQPSEVRQALQPYLERAKEAETP